MIFSPQTIGFDGFSMVLESFNHWFQWFSMVMDHWFNYAMVSMNCSPLVVVVVVVVVVLVVDCWLPYSIYLDLDFHLCTMTEPKEHSREICYLEVVGPFFKKVSCLLEKTGTGRLGWYRVIIWSCATVCHDFSVTDSAPAMETCNILKESVKKWFC